MLSSRLIYTAWTRASRKCEVIGDKELIIKALGVKGDERLTRLDLDPKRLKARLKARLTSNST